MIASKVKLERFLDDLLVIMNKHNVSIDSNKLDILDFDSGKTSIKIGSFIQDASWEWSVIDGQSTKQEALTDP